VRAPFVLATTADLRFATRIERIVTAEEIGCRFLHIGAGRLALARAQSNPPDVLLVAATLPDIRSEEFIEQIKLALEKSQVPVVLCVDDETEPERIADLCHAGADDVLHTSASDAEISLRIRAVLRLKDAEDRVRANRARIRSLNAEQAALLRQSEERFRALAQYATEGVAVATPEGLLKYISPAMEKIIGWSAEEAEGICLWDVVHQADRLRLRTAWEALARSPMAANVVEARVRSKSGEWCWLRVVASNQLHNPGVHGIVLNCHDISDRRRIADALAASQSRYRRFVETTREGIWATDPNECTTFVNERLAEMLGYDPPELLGKPVEQLLLPEDRESHRQRILRRARGELETYEQRFVRKDGSIMWALVSASPMLDHETEYSGAFAMLTDITEQKRMHQELRDALSRFEALIEATPLVAVQGINADGTIVLWNRACEVLYGYPRNDAIGKRLQDLLLEPEDIPEFERVLAEVWQSGVPTLPSEWRVKTAGEQTRIVFSTLVPVCSGGEVTCVYCMDVDITQAVEAREALKESERRLRQLNVELGERVAERTRMLEQAVDDLDSFAYSVTHDLRAPLRAMTGFSNALLEDYGDKLDSDARRYLQHIIDGVRRMERLINDLLEFSRSGRRQVDMRELDMAEIVELAMTDQDQEALKRCEIVVGDLPPARADRSLVLQVFVNLLSNAVKYSRTREKPRIEIWGEATADGFVRYSVRDNGVGYDPRYADKLFNVFQRLHNETEFEGTGVGLATVHRIVRRHGGSVGSESQQGQGATFWITLPAAPAYGAKA
jgi:PAS domain S-box-containing protein